MLRWSLFIRRNYQQAVDKLCDLLVIQKEAEAAGAFGALVAVDVHLVGFELVRLLPCDVLNVAAALDRQHAEGRVRRSLFDLREHALAHAGLLGRLLQTHRLGLADAL